MAWIELAEVDVLSRLTDAEVAACKNAAVRAGQPVEIGRAADKPYAYSAAGALPAASSHI